MNVEIKDQDIISSRIDNDQNLIIFLRGLADSIEDNKLEDKNKQLIGEFFMKYKFYDFSNDNTVEKLDVEDVKTFLFLGWFIYCFILKDERFKKMLK
jgi:hypothetical protein